MLLYLNLSSPRLVSVPKPRARGSLFSREAATPDGEWCKHGVEERGLLTPDRHQSPQKWQGKCLVPELTCLHSLTSFRSPGVLAQQETEAVINVRPPHSTGQNNQDELLLRQHSHYLYLLLIFRTSFM